MQNKIFLSLILNILILLLVCGVISKECSSTALSRMSIRAACELENGTPVSCFGSLVDVKRAYVRCENGYFNEKNQSVQIIDCDDVKGEWSDEIMRCKPICVEPPNIDDIKLIENNDDNGEFPPWYVEVIRKEPIEGEINKFPGIIVDEREILTLEKYIKAEKIDLNNFGPTNFHPINLRIGYAKSFWIRIYKTKTDYINIEPWDFHCLKLSFDKTFEKYCYISIGDIIHRKIDYIKYNKNVKPVCADKNYPIIENRKSQHNDKLLKGNKHCIAPRNTNPKLEVLCFKEYEKSIPQGIHIRLLPADCLEEDHYLLLTRCRLGYEYARPNKEDFLSKCYKGDWENYEKNDCNLICGKIDENYRPFETKLIYNGNKTDITLSPWHVGIFSNDTILSNNFEQICGGTILHHNIIISAAHCFYDIANSVIYPTSNYLVGAGKNFRTFNADEKDSFFSEVKEIHLPENYQSSNTLNDIAILILQKSLPYSAHIKPVCIDFSQYTDYTIQSGVDGQINGWGSRSNDGKQTNELRTANLKTLTNDECKNLVHPNHRSSVIGDKFCAVNEFNSTACQGDSGGGFIVKKNIGNGDRYYLTGIISTGIDRTKYCSNGFLTLFTNIQFYQNFIKDIISENRNSYDFHYQTRNRQTYYSHRHIH